MSVGVLSSLSLDATYCIYYFICIILFCSHIVFLMTITTFEFERNEMFFPRSSVNIQYFGEPL